MPLLEIENANRETNLQFKMDGPVFESGIPIPILVDSLAQVQGILDKSYLGLIDRKRISQDERLKFFLQTQKIEKGSLLSNIGLIYTGAQTVLPIFGALGPNGIWEYAKMAFSFIKLVFEASRKGEPIRYEFNADRSIVQVNTGSQSNFYDGPVYNIASMSINHYQNLSSALDISRVTDIRLGEGDRRDISISLPEKDAFKFPTRIEETPHRIECEVFEFDKYEKDGRLRVGKAQSIPEGSYRFEVVGKQEASEYVAAMLEKMVRVTCLREVSENPISGEKIFRLQVIGVEA